MSVAFTEINETVVDLLRQWSGYPDSVYPINVSDFKREPKPVTKQKLLGNIAKAIAQLVQVWPLPHTTSPALICFPQRHIKVTK